MEKNLSIFDEKVIKNYDEDSNKNIFLDWMLNILKVYIICIAIYHSYQKEWELKKCNRFNMIKCNIQFVW